MGTQRRKSVVASAQSPAFASMVALLFLSAYGAIDAPAQAKDRSGEQIVAAQCATCHETGKSGAPKIGDRSAWIARAKQGLDPLVASAMKGHGGMPARGGLSELSDAELRSAVVYMLNSGSGAVTGQDYRIVADTTLDFGVVSASTMRSRAKDYPTSVYGTAPSLPDHYYVTVAAFDARTGRRITDAVVRARVTGAAGAGREQTLKPITVGDAVSYGGYFPMAGGGPYKVAVHVTRPGASAPVDAQFQYTP